MGIRLSVVSDSHLSARNPAASRHWDRVIEHLLRRAGGRRLVVSGHVHQCLRHSAGGIDHLWVPATWASLPDRIQPPVGVKLVGIVALTLHDDGRHDVELQHPGGLRQATAGVDVDDPYARVPV